MAKARRNAEALAEKRITISATLITALAPYEPQEQREVAQARQRLVQV